MIARLLALFFGLFFSLAYGLDSTLQAGVTSFSISETIDNQTVDRAVIIQAPSTISTDTQYPIVISLHGHGGTAQTFVNLFSDAVDTYQFVGVYPQGYNNSWDLGGKHESDADDYAFIDTIVTTLKQLPQLKNSPIYVVGFSNGALLANELAVEKPYITAIAAFSSNLLSNEQPTDTTKPTSVLLVRGLKDSIIPNGGGYDELVDHDFLSTKDTLSTWAANNHCTTEPNRTLTDYGNIKITYGNCVNDTEVVGYLCPQCGHGIPDDMEGDKLALIFNFFKNHRH